MAIGLTVIPWAEALILLPLTGAMSAFLWPRRARALGLVTTLLLAVPVTGLGIQMTRVGVYRHLVGGWGVPLGIELYADGLSLILLVATVVVGIGVSVYAASYFRGHEATRFWPLWLFLLAALDALFLSRDIFNIYVALELLGLAAVALAALSGGIDALGSAMRYLLATLLGSLLYLLGVALLYHGFGTVDIDVLALRIKPAPAVWAAMGLMGAGLCLKTAIFPLHFWLPPAHASAPAPVSAALSGLVVKASFYVLLRLWINVFGPLAVSASVMFGLLGAVAILWGSLQALRQVRLKLLVAYSTIAQIGYLFLAFPLGAAAGMAGWGAAIYLALSHALAKAAMFLAVGNIQRFGGHDQISDLDRVAQRLPLSTGAFALAGVSIVGLPPSGGFVGKWLLLQVALTQGRWIIAVVIVVGSLLATAYVFRVLGHAFTQAPVPHEARPVSLHMQWAAMLLACGAVLLGFIAPFVLSVMGIGHPFGMWESGS